MKSARKIDASVPYFNPRLRKILPSILKRPMAVVEAPMGFGKTMAVREYLRETGLRAVWTTALGAGPDIFWRDFCRNLDRALPAESGTIAALRQLGYPRDAVQTGEAYHLFLDLEPAEETALVIDDFHLLPVPKGKAPAGIGGLFELLAARDDNIRLRMILVSRNTYTGNRDLLLLKKLLTVIDRDALALSETDIRAYCRLIGVRLAPEKIHDLFLRTSGWISALYLHLLHYGRHNAAADVEALDRLVDREVLAPMPPEALELLLATCPMERFTRAQAEFVLGEDEVDSILNVLLRENPFLGYDASDGTYMLHAVVRDNLVRRFEALPPARRRAIWAACGECALADGDVVTALRFFGTAEQYERALEAIESGEGRRLVTRDIESFRRIFDACPDGALDRHIFAEFQYALCAFIGGRAELFAERLGRLAARCAAMPEGDAEADSRRIDLEFLRSLAAYNDIAAMSRHHRRANELRRGGATGHFTHQAPWTLGSPSVLFMFHRESGGLDGELGLMRECMPHYRRLASGHGSGAEHQMEAEALYHRGDFAGAAIFAERAAASARSRGQLGIVLAALFVRQRLLALEGDYPAARSLLDEMRADIRDKHDYYYLHTVDLCEGELLAALGRTGGAAAWLKQGAGGEERLYHFAGGYYYIVHGGILLSERRWPEATGLYAWLLESGAFSNNLLLTIHARLFLAAANQALGRTAEAAAELRRAGDLAFPDGIVMPFVNVWRFLADTPVDDGNETAAAAFSRIRDIAGRWEARRREILTRDFPPERPILTKRELELARMAAAGMRHREIADAVYLAHSTVKRAFVTIYNKLGISSREELREFLDRIEA